MKRIKRYLTRCSITAFLIFSSAAAVFADDTSWYKNNEAILNNNDIVESGARWLGWKAIKLLCMLADATQTLYDKTFGLIDITNYAGVNNIILQLRPVLVALTVLCLVGFSFMALFQKDKKPIVRNILMAVFVLTCSVYMFSTANAMVSSFKEGMLQGQYVNESYAAVNDNMIDLVGIDKKGSIINLNYEDSSGILHTANINSKASLGSIDINETLNWSDPAKGKTLYGWSDTFNNLIKNKAVRLPDGNYTTKENYNGVLTTDIGNKFYYRYSFDFWSTALELFSLVVIFVSLSYKNVRMAYELVISRILAYMYTADVGNGERLKSILMMIRDIYITLCVSILCIRIYQIMAGAITSLGVTGLAKGLVLVFIAYAVIDGPNIVERITGIDAGLSSSFARAMAVFGLAKGATKAAFGGASKVASEAADGAAASRTGKTKAERLQENGHASFGEKIGKKVNERFGQNTLNDNISQSDDNNINKDVNNPNDFMSSSPNINAEGKSTNTSFMSDNSNKTRSGRFHNEEFTQTVRSLAPDKNASAGERKDFNRQVNNIVRGDHTAIEPPKGTKADYKFKNYEKAKKMEEAYHKGGKVNK